MWRRWCPSGLLDPPTHLTQRKSSRRAGADHQVRSAGGLGGGGPSLGSGSGRGGGWGRGTRVGGVGCGKRGAGDAVRAVRGTRTWGGGALRGNVPGSSSGGSEVFRIYGGASGSRSGESGVGGGGRALAPRRVGQAGAGASFGGEGNGAVSGAGFLARRAQRMRGAMAVPGGHRALLPGRAGEGKRLLPRVVPLRRQVVPAGMDAVVGTAGCMGQVLSRVWVALGRLASFGVTVVAVRIQCLVGGWQLLVVGWVVALGARWGWVLLVHGVCEPVR